MVGFFLFIVAIILFQRGKHFASLLLFFLFLNNGFQLIPVAWLMAGFPLDKSSDLAIFFVAIITFIKRKDIGKITKDHPLFNWFLYIVGFAAVDAFYSYFFLHYSPVNVLQVFRPYLLFLSFVVFFVVPPATLKRVFHAVALITLFQCVLFLFQIVTGQTILLSANGDDNITTGIVEGAGYIRFYNQPAFLIPTLFYFLFVFKFKNKLIQVGVLGILVLTVIGPMHRSLIVTIVAVISLFTLFQQSLSKRIIYILMLGLVIYVLSFIDVLGKRMGEAFSDMQTTFTSNLSVANIDVSENSTLFRIGHLVERLDYVESGPMRWLFGIGLISDNAPYADQLPFKFGLISETTGQVVQIDTSDLVWSPLILTLGIVGTLLYATVFIVLLVHFFKKTKYNSYNIVGFLTVLAALFLSMAGNDMTTSSFRIIMILVAVIGCSSNDELFAFGKGAASKYY
ncbi:MAG TPA: hypothetical protein VNS58_08200 [Puia sp.]|nr:hypothetical protein [Puia sp.]